MISLGRVFGFPLSLDFTALAVIAILALGGARSGPGAAAQGTAMAGVIFGSVLVHELGHAFVARFYKLGPIDISLNGFGGLTRFARSPSPRQGILVTAAGPLAGLALGLVAIPFALLLPGAGGSLFERTAYFNLFWSVFNLLPMYPLDGGSVLAYVLALFVAPGKAMRWAARVGLVVSLGVGLVAWQLGQVFIAIVAVLSLMRSARVAFAR